MEEAEETRRNPGVQKSTTYVICSACLAALILGMTIFLLVRGFQWRGALAELRSEPGIEILSVERLGFFKKRLRGLRDPLAPTAESILSKHNIGPRSAEVLLTEYYSLNTPYGIERREKKEAEFVDFRNSLTSAVGEFAKTMQEKREADLEKITKMLFDAKFPKEMETVDINWKENEWKISGGLYAPDREAFLAEAPNYIVEGEINSSDLANLTETRGSALRNQIESTNLLSKDIDNQFAHIERIVRLIGDYDFVCESSNLPLPRFRIEAETTNRDNTREEVEEVREKLMQKSNLGADRFLIDSIRVVSNLETPEANLSLVPGSNSQALE